MMHEDMIRMMRESGLKVHDTSPPDAIERFVALVAQWGAEREREACAKLAGPHLDGAIAAAIRARN
jgi:hypothetical protein